MKTRLVTAVAGALLALASSASADTTINTIVAWQDSAFPNKTVGWDKTGQSFKVPRIDTTLATWTVGVRSTLGTPYRLRVYAWDVAGNHPTGPALFDSGSLSAPATLQFVEHQVGLTLQAGGNYTTVVEWDPNAPPNTQGNVAYFSSASTQGGYPGGHLSNAIHFLPPTTPWDFDASWDLESGFAATFVTPSPWVDLGGGSPGINGTPLLNVKGPLTVASTLSLDLTNAAPSEPTLFWMSFASTPLDIFGGTLFTTVPPNLQLLRFTDATGAFSQSVTWPAGIPAGLEFYTQFLIQDLSVPADITLSNGMRATTP